MSELEDLEKLFSSTLKSNNDIENKHKQLYKNCSSSKNSQDERRRHLLSLQKTKRQSIQNENRDFDNNNHLKRKISDVWKQEINFMREEKNEREEWYRQTHQYRNLLMFSEWLLEMPDDFPEWIMVPCPKGQRTLLVSRSNYTTCYSKYGSAIQSFKCLLPRNTILDCIFCRKTNTFYVLDLLQWNGHCVKNCQADFRFFWVTSKLIECHGVGEHSSRNDYAIKDLPRFKCERQTLADSMSHYPMFPNDEPALDGLLFFHPGAFHSAGTTPLIGWLKPFMLPEVLPISISEKYMEEKPESYTSVSAYVEWFDQELKQKKEKNTKTRWSRNKSMKLDSDMSSEVAEVEPEICSESS